MRHRFKKARTQLNLSINECAELLSISPSTIRRYEKHEPRTTDLLYLELLNGNLYSNFGKRWLGWTIDKNGKINNGIYSYYPDEYNRIALQQNIIDTQQRTINTLKNNYQFDLFTCNTTK